MTTPIPFVPTPRLDYTIKYNQMKDDQRYYLEQQQKTIYENEKLRLQQFQEEQRTLEKRKMQEELAEIRQYESLSKQKNFNDYKYAYWAGTLVDRYI